MTRQIMNRYFGSMMSIKIAAFAMIVLAASGCKQKETTNSDNGALSINNERIKYATVFDIVDYDDYTKVVINNPWDMKSSKPFAVYYLYREDNDNIPTEGGFKLQIPIESVVVNTFSYFEFLQQLGKIDKVVAVTDAERVYNPIILEGLASGKIDNLGDPFNPNIERTLMLGADAIINSAYVQQDNLSERAQKLGLPVIFSLEWMETSALARAEWIKLIAEFVDKRDLAELIFNDIEQRYIDNTNLVKDVENKPEILSGDNFQDTWYVPGGSSFNGHLFNDAGANYYYSDNKETGSIGLDIESVLTQFGQAEVWIGCEANTYAELENKDSKYKLFKSIKEKRAFNNRNKTTPTGGNDYFESAIAHPDLMLRDLIKALHPDILPEHQFIYIKPLK